MEEVNTILRLDNKCIADKHVVAVLDVQILDSQAVVPRRAAEVKSTVPSSRPKTLTRAFPLAGRFDSNADDRVIRSYETC